MADAKDFQLLASQPTVCLSFIIIIYLFIFSLISVSPMQESWKSIKAKLGVICSVLIHINWLYVWVVSYRLQLRMTNALVPDTRDSMYFRLYLDPFTIFIYKEMIYIKDFFSGKRKKM